MEVLAARARLGEPFWTFERRDLPAIRTAAGHGLVWFEEGKPSYRSVRVGMTDAGREAWLAPGYTTPADRVRAELAEANATISALKQMLREQTERRRIAERAAVATLTEER
jgi:hypothetical protein